MCHIKWSVEVCGIVQMKDTYGEDPVRSAEGYQDRAAERCVRELGQGLHSISSLLDYQNLTFYPSLPALLCIVCSLVPRLLWGRKRHLLCPAKAWLRR